MRRGIEKQLYLFVRACILGGFMEVALHSPRMAQLHPALSKAGMGLAESFCLLLIIAKTVAGARQMWEAHDNIQAFRQERRLANAARRAAAPGAA